MGEKCLRGLGWKTGKRPLERTRNRFEENIELHHKEDGMIWMAFIWLRLRTCGGLL
jgi:hypothetical protein